MMTCKDGMGRGEGGRRWTYNYGCFRLLYGGNQHNIVKIKKQKINTKVLKTFRLFTLNFRGKYPMP